MNFDWTRLQTLACDLAKTPSDESKLRSAVSRTYYAALGMARRYLMVRHPSRFHRDAADHETVWNLFDELADKEPGIPASRQRIADLRYLSRAGKRLRRSRNAADYDDSLAGVGDVSKWVELQLDTGRWILEMVVELSGETH